MIQMFFDMLPSGILQGLILAIIALGVMIPFKLLNFPDLTAEGAYPFGGALCATFISYQVDPIAATLMTTILGVFWVLLQLSSICVLKSIPYLLELF